jgi:hypothetical protein
MKRWARYALLVALIVGFVSVAAPLFAQAIENNPHLASLFVWGNDEQMRSHADCPDPQGGAQARTPGDTYGCFASLADSRPFNGSWLDVRIKPLFALVYVNGRYVGTAEQFTSPFRPLRVGVGPQHVEFRAPGYRTVSFWMNGETAKTTTATGSLLKKP